MSLSPELQQRLNMAAEYGHEFYYLSDAYLSIESNYYDGSPEQEQKFMQNVAFLTREEAETYQRKQVEEKLELIRLNLRNETVSSNELCLVEAWERFIDISDIELLGAIYFDR